MLRLLKALGNSWRAGTHLARGEAAFRQELAMLVVAVPLGWFLATDWRSYALLLAAILVVILVEVLNTAVEATCNAVSREFHADIRIAKDCGSLAVLIAIVLAAGVWALALYDRLAGLPA